MGGGEGGVSNFEGERGDLAHGSELKVPEKREIKNTIVVGNKSTYFLAYSLRGPGTSFSFA